MDGELRWLARAARELGTREVAGAEHNPRILEYHRQTGLGASEDETSWCSSFVNWVLSGAGVAGTRSAAARSWLNWGQASPARPGAICVLWRGDPRGWQGHVGFLVAADEEFVWLLGGNQGDAVTLARFPVNRVLGYRWPVAETS